MHLLTLHKPLQLLASPFPVGARQVIGSLESGWSESGLLRSGDFPFLCHSVLVEVLEALAYFVGLIVREGSALPVAKDNESDELLQLAEFHHPKVIVLG